MAPKAAAIDQEMIRALARLLDDTGLTEIEIEQEGLRVRVARQAAFAQASMHAVHVPPPPVAAPAPAAIEIPLDPGKHPGVVTSPMVGVAYLAPEPGARPFVDIGSVVKAGDPVLIIEAMKTMNQIPAPRAGTVKQILIEDGRPVEFGEPLMIIE
jgi:acetyl-CoA carboxylase biotin carboxyl carrier protein